MAKLQSIQELELQSSKSGLV